MPNHTSHQLGISCPHCFELYKRYIEMIDQRYQKEILTRNLPDCEYNVFSQFGEDGVIGHLFSGFNIDNGTVVEVGAGDGKLYSNIYNLIKQGFSSVSIEGDSEKFKKLKENYSEYSGSICHNGYISLEPNQKLDDILDLYNVPFDFDLLSLDIDGNDFWVWQALKYEPKVVVVEYNSSFQGDVTVPYNKDHKWDRTLYYGASAPLLEKLGNYKGYDLVCIMQYSNLVFVKKSINKDYYLTMDLEHRYYKNLQHDQMSEEQKKSLLHINWDEFVWKLESKIGEI